MNAIQAQYYRMLNYDTKTVFLALHLLTFWSFSSWLRPALADNLLLGLQRWLSGTTCSHRPSNSI